MAELKDKIQSALLSQGTIEKPRILRLSPVGKRYLVYLTSPSFKSLSTLESQRLVSSALKGETSSLTAEDRKQIGFIRILTPARVKALARRHRAKKGKSPRDVI